MKPILFLTEIWQFDQNHNMLDYVGEGNRFNYKMATETEYLFTAKINIKDNTKKVVFKISKSSTKKASIPEILKAIPSLISQIGYLPFALIKKRAPYPKSFEISNFSSNCSRFQILIQNTDVLSLLILVSQRCYLDIFSS
ncbi:MAG: hypothetical protein IPJ39_06555 [Saprospiraceae bacterium]|nr:hypothetical protein [Saprospiraceae bacterium]